jgi:hypothetical protein
MRTKFYTDVVQLWDELNALLAEQFAYQPDVCRATRMAGQLAISIRHLPEVLDSDEKQDLATSAPCALLCDVGDAWKHGQLRNPERRNTLGVTADFEFIEAQFSYLRNAILIRHATRGELDFMIESATAIEFWLSRMGWSDGWRGQLKFAQPSFGPEAFLYFNGNHSIVMKATQLRFFERNSTGALIAADPAVVKFAIYDANRAKQ